jgi:hypothetical protein
MFLLHEIIRDAARNLSSLSGDDFIEEFTKTLAGLFTAFYVGRAIMRNARGACAGPVTVIATSPIQNGEIDADAVAAAAFICVDLD